MVWIFLSCLCLYRVSYPYESFGGLRCWYTLSSKFELYRWINNWDLYIYQWTDQKRTKYHTQRQKLFFYNWVYVWACLFTNTDREPNRNRQKLRYRPMDRQAHLDKFLKLKAIISNKDKKCSITNSCEKQLVQLFFLSKTASFIIQIINPPFSLVNTKSDVFIG